MVLVRSCSVGFHITAPPQVQGVSLSLFLPYPFRDMHELLGARHLGKNHYGLGG